MRMLHTMLRVGDLDRSIAFYTGVLGMQVLRKTDLPDQQYTLAFVGYGDERTNAVLELTYNYGVDRYDLGTAYGHVAIEVDDAAATCDSVSKSEQNEDLFSATRFVKRDQQISLRRCRPTPSVVVPFHTPIESDSRTKCSRVECSDRPDLDASLTSWWDLRCRLDGFVQVARFDQIEAGELLLRLREGPVRH